MSAVKNIAIRESFSRSPAPTGKNLQLKQGCVWRPYDQRNRSTVSALADNDSTSMIHASHRALANSSERMRQWNFCEMI